MKKGLKKLLAIFLIELIILLPIAIVDAMTISNIRAEDITQNSAKVKWDTSENSQGKVNFGENTSLESTASSQNFVKNHSIQLSSLNEGRQYYFEVLSDNGTQEIVDNNAGNFYTFTALPAGQLFINVSIPPYLTTRRYDIIGASKRFASIDMHVNNNAPRTLAVDNSGRFVFSGVSLDEGNNTIRFEAKSGSDVVQAVYTAKVDTSIPNIVLSEIPNTVGKKLIVNGSVSERVELRFYVADAEKDFTPPPKVTGLINTSIRPNIVELTWDNSNLSDFLKYIIYRNNKPISLITSQDYNDYSDAFVNSNKTYAYEVAVMDKSGNIGEKSTQLVVSTPPGGANNRPEPAEVDIHEGENGLQKTITVGSSSSSSFREELTIGGEDGFYNIKVEAVDEAGNSWSYNKDVLLDTKNPEIEITSPKSNAEIYENYANSVTIRGVTEPGARVYLYVQRTPLGVFNMTYDVSGAPDEVQQIPESELRAGCAFEVLGEEQCMTHADYETVADANGNFEFEKVDLTSLWAGAIRFTEYPTGAPYIAEVDRANLKDSMESNLVFVGVDAAGKKGMNKVSYRIVNCWSGDMTWGANPLPQYQSPTFLNIERLKEGSEAIYFYLNFTYHGIGKEARVTNVFLAKACGTGYLESQERYNYSCSILSSCNAKLSPTGKTVYVSCPLRRIDGMEKWKENDWKNFMETIRSEMTFPFKLTLSYDEVMDNKTLESRKEHTLCTEVGYVVDASHINPREVLPDWLLYDFVDVLNKSITSLNDWISKIREVLQWVAIGCIVSILVKFVVQIYRRITCHYDKFFKKLQDIGGSSEQDDKCKACIQNDQKTSEAYKKGKDFQDSLSDTCLKVCYPSCSGAWGTESALYKTYRFACDRTFGHATPSKWTEPLSDTQIFQKLSEGSGCANDQSVRGRPLRAESCKSFEQEYGIKGTFDLDDRCIEITDSTNLGGTKALYEIGSKAPLGEELYNLNYKSGSRTIGYTYAIRQNEENYLTYMKESCEEICTKQSKNKIDSGKLTTAKGKTITLGQDAKTKEIKSIKGSKVDDKTVDTAPKKNYVVSWGCLTPNECISYASKNSESLKTDEGDETVDVNTAVPMGYTENCFDPSTVSGNPDKRIECCCINSETGAMPGYYQPGDVENKNSEDSAQFTPANKYEEMTWSYRYSKINYKQKKYNKDRYISGRDYTACFGQNDLLHDGITVPPGQVGKLLVIDPMKNHLAAFQCVAISQIYNRLMLIKNIMVAFENCLLTIRTTGRADVGVCKELFSQYICAFIWKIITWIRDGCLPFGSGVDFTKSENSVLEAVSVGMKGVFDSVGDTQNEIASEYGNAQLNNLLGLGEEDVFRKVCLAAFGYDWEIDLDSIIDISYNTPYATLVQAILQSREFLTFDPTSYKAKYDYRASWLINPGCDMDNYEVYLACVTKNDIRSHGDINCAKQKDPYGKNCDCLELSPEKAPQPLFFYQSQSNIRQNQLIQVDSSQIQNRIKTSAYRYDHLMFKLNVNRNMAANSGDTSKCFPQGHEDGIFYFPITDYTAREIAGCVLEPTSGIFSCQQGASFFYEQGDAYFTEIALNKNPALTDMNNQDKINIGATYYAGSSESISGKIRYSKDERKQCLIMRLVEKDLSTIIRAPAPIELKKGFTEGQENIGMIYTMSDKDLAGGSSSGLIISYDDDHNERKTAAGKLSYTIIKNPVAQGGGPLEFIDKNNDGKISFSKDSADTYSYQQSSEIKIKDKWSSDGVDIELNDIGAKIKVKGVSSTQANPARYLFIIESSASGSSGTGSTSPKYYLHLDLRHPIDQDSSCSDVAGPGYDDSQVIVSGGIKQSVDIPIYVMPGQRSIEKCESNNERVKIMATNNDNEKVKQNNYCVCGTGSNKNCPTDDYDYCYGQCRKYKRCEFAEALTAPCVCDPSTSRDKFDCGAPKNAESSAFTEDSREGWHCYEDSSKVSRCQQAPPPPTNLNAGDTTPLQVTILSPTAGSQYNVGDTISIAVRVIDDKVSKKERCDIYVEGKKVRTSPPNTGELLQWDISYPYVVAGPASRAFDIYAECKDSSMVSGNQVTKSEEIGVNIN